MKIELTKNLAKKVTPVFILFGKEKLDSKKLFLQLDELEKERLIDFQKNVAKEEFGLPVILSANRRALVFRTSSFESHRQAILLARKIITFARQERMERILIDFDDFIVSEKIAKEILIKVLATQLEIANFEFVKYKTPPPEGWFFVKEVFIYLEKSGTEVNKLRQSIKEGKIIGEEINKARNLANTPGGDMTPQVLAAEAVKTGRRAGFRTKILKENELKKLGMGGILGVSRGSIEKPRLIVMEYFGGKKDEKPIILVGKGITFDSGGLNLKPTQGIYEMHMDMSGGAATIGALAAAARLRLKKNIIGLVPEAENMPSGSSYRPGDLLKTMSGKVVEVLNTDAEGRIILADALTYAQKYYAPRIIVDVATLTGAAMVALGQRASAIFSNNEKLQKFFQEMGEITGDFVWPLPLWKEYEEDIKGIFGDLANIDKRRSGYGGAIYGAVFLWQFVRESKEILWAHLDIAPRMTSIEGDFLAKGATGAPIALLVEFLTQEKFENL